MPDYLSNLCQGKIGFERQTLARKRKRISYVLKFIKWWKFKTLKRNHPLLIEALQVKTVLHPN
jgi:hypothetical protein